MEMKKKTGLSPWYRRLAISAAITPLFLSIHAHAMRIDTGDSDVRVRWDNTLKYSAAARVEKHDSEVTGSSYSANFDDGDQNFNRGPISNRLDLLSEFDLEYKNAGLRISGAAWYDDIYNKGNDNNSPATNNSVSAGHNRFTDDTERLHGRDAEILDAFVFGRTELAGKPVSARLGRHTVLYGESLFFGGNGIANAQSSIDAVKALSVPSSQFKEIARPINQLSSMLQLSPELAVGGYYQFEWRKYRIPAAGSYFSTSDLLDDGGERLAIGPTNDLAFFRGHDLEARDSGQGGVQVKWKPAGTGLELGLYAAQYHDKVPVVYLYPGVGSQGLGQYALVYPEDIKLFGASLSTLVGDTNVAGEISFRHDTPLTATGGAVAVGAESDNSGNPAYPVGDSFHAQISTITVLNESMFWDGATLLTEIGFNRRLRITDNKDQLDPNATRDAWGVRALFEPQYFQVLPQLDLSVPISIGWAPSGRSSVYSFGPEDGGDVSIGLAGVFQGVYRAGLSYTHYFGSKGAVVDEENRFSYKQSLADRDFISFNIQRTF